MDRRRKPTRTNLRTVTNDCRDFTSHEAELNTRAQSSRRRAYSRRNGVENETVVTLVILIAFIALCLASISRFGFHSYKEVAGAIVIAIVAPTIAVFVLDKPVRRALRWFRR